VHAPCLSDPASASTANPFEADVAVWRSATWPYGGGTLCGPVGYLVILLKTMAWMKLLLWFRHRFHIWIE